VAAEDVFDSVLFVCRLTPVIPAIVDNPIARQSDRKRASIGDL
jgi:hypothetical protein